MKPLTLILTLLSFYVRSQAQARLDTTVRQYTIPIEGSSYIPIHKFSTQIDLLLGTSVLLKGDRPMPSFYGEVKGYYFPTGAIYICTGIGFGSLHSESRPTPDHLTIISRSTNTISMPTGIGFTMGDDRANFFSGINLTPVVYLQAPEGIVDTRVFSWGIMPEFGFRMKVGRRDQKGVQLGLVGQWHLLMPPSKESGNNLRHATYAGAGLVIRFY